MTSSEHYTRGLDFLNNEKFDQAIEDFNAAIKIEPDYPIAKNKLYWAYCNRAKLNLWQEQKPDPAIADYTEAINLNLNRAEAYQGRGIAYDVKGDNAKAIADWEAVLKISPDDATTKELLDMARKGQ